MIHLKCFHCGTELKFSSQPGRRDECPQCRSDVHVCKNCVHHDPKSYNECREPQAEVVKERDRSNYCDFFSPGNQSGAVDKSAQLKAAAEALFKKK